MRTLLTLGAALIVLLSAQGTAATSLEDQKAHERWEREQLHPRGELSAEQMARIKAEPRQVVVVDPIERDPVEMGMLEQLQDAKRAGNAALIREIEVNLALYRGDSPGSVEVDSPDGHPLTVEFTEDVGGGGDRWLPHEFLLVGGEFSELRPTMASDAAGNLYAAFQEETEPGEHTLQVYRSTDGGEHWSRLFWVYGANMISPSIAVGEGTENWLFVAFHNQTTEKIYVIRYSLDTMGVSDFTTILDNPLGVSNPRIVTDCSEYAGWYAYIVFNAMAVDNWVFEHARTTDYGDTWTTPEIVGGYCGYPGEFYDATHARPDIEYGSGNLHIAFDNYPSPCTSAQRDIFLLTSHNFGGSWDPVVALTTHSNDEHDPAVAAVKSYPDNITTVVAYTRDYYDMDDDVWFTYSQDDGATWDSPSCIACSTPQERNINLVTSNDTGYIHGAFWDEFNINYAVADYSAPDAWTRHDSLSTLDTVSDIDCRPAITIDPTAPAAEEAGIAWTDFRNEAGAGLDIFYDAAVLPEPDVDYYLYSTLNPGVGSVCAIDGFIDEAGAVEGVPGAEYLVFTGGPLYEGDITAYLYRVETDGDPETHPDNPLNTGPIATRTFSLVSSHFMGNFACAHDNSFYVDATGIYYGPSNNPRGDAPGWAEFMGGAVWRWDFDWALQECVVPTAAPGGNQTLARNPNTGEWWAGISNRAMYKWVGAAWVYQFAAPHLGGGHHDGLEVIGNSLYVSDMTSDAIIQYRLDDAGNAIDPPGTPCRTFFYSHAPAVEGMGHGPNEHIWVSSGGGTLYELGGGALQLAVDGIPDQCVLPDDPFAAFDLDDYVAGIPPYSWSWEGNVDLEVSADGGNVVTVTYPPGWEGQETVTFTVTDGLERIASDQAIFTVAQPVVVGDIPDQLAPFESFDLDDYLIEGPPELISWTATGMTCLDVDIDPETHVATVSDPGGCSGSEVITFIASVSPCGGVWSDSDPATFDPGFSDVVHENSASFSLGYPLPNPCTTGTRVEYSIPPVAPESEVVLAIYDVAGHRVRTLVNSTGITRGGSISWDGTDERGLPVTSGTYFLQLQWNEKYMSRRVVLLR